MAKFLLNMVSPSLDRTLSSADVSPTDLVESLTVRIIGPDGLDLPEGEATAWGFFREELIKTGCKVISSDTGVRAHGCFLVNQPGWRRRRELLKSFPVSQRILFLSEPVIVLPQMYRRRAIARFGFVYSPSPFRVPVSETRVHVLAAPIRQRSGVDWCRVDEQLKAACMIVANKVSFVPSQNYSLRREVVRLCKEREVPLDLYGADWGTVRVTHIVKAAFRCLVSFTKPDMTALKSLSARSLSLGGTNDKLHCAGRYRIAVVIENCGDYISEKLFDAVEAGCVVLYVGPPLAPFGLFGAAIECERSAESVARAIESALSMDFGTLEKIRVVQAEAVEKCRRLQQQRIREMAQNVKADLLSIEFKRNP